MPACRGRLVAWTKDTNINDTIATTTPRQRALDAVNSLPPDVTIEDAIERLLFIARVEKGIADADADKTIPHEEVVKRMKR